MVVTNFYGVHSMASIPTPCVVSPHIRPGHRCSEKRTCHLREELLKFFDLCLCCPSLTPLVTADLGEARCYYGSSPSEASGDEQQERAPTATTANVAHTLQLRHWATEQSCS